MTAITWCEVEMSAVHDTLLYISVIYAKMMSESVL